MLPFELVRLQIGEFIKTVLDPYHKHLQSFWLENDIDQVEQDHIDRLKAYNAELTLKVMIDKHNYKSVSFQVALADVDG